MKTRYIISLLATALVFSSCSDFLETEPSGATITTKQKETVLQRDPAKATAGVNSLYFQFHEYQSAISGNHNDIGYGGLMLLLDGNGYDMVSSTSGYNWFAASVTYSSRNYSSDEVYMIWMWMYKQLKIANGLLESYDKDSPLVSVQSLIGQAYAVRAFDYWVLAQLFQFNYADHQDAPCVPLITDENALEAANDGIGRSTVKEVYEQIFSDIDNAIAFLEKAEAAGDKRIDKRYVNSAVAYALRARFNLTTENWTAAAEDAAKALALAEKEKLAPYSIATLKSGPLFWDSANETSYLWADVIDEKDDVVESAICNFPSHMGSLSYGYGWYSGGRLISKKLFGLISISDARHGWWLDAEGHSDILNADFAKVMDSHFGNEPYTQVKFAPYRDEASTTVNANDLPLIRVEELYLIKAEAEAHTNPATALETLTGFVKTYRDTEYAFDSTDGDEIAEEVYRQRRIEFWGEGISWFDIMRLNKDVDRRGAGFPKTAVFNIPAGSDILLYRIPETEINANKKLSDADNNPAAPSPKAVEDEDA
ncbi:MAG: RagB/SusD family nutrient uptake outer membrane protein [Bacteroidales bacterium]|nr:RagB/SusD family nutrient uptake outer membrane protein [Bacteroidales bacterium]